MTLLLIGAGELGGRVADLWHPAVLAETRTPRPNAPWPHRLRHDPAPTPHSHVLFCIPPSANDDYLAEAARAVDLFDGDGALIMISSTAVYAESDGGPCVETSPTATTPRAGRLLAAESAVLAGGGCVVRMAGLYNANRGPHRVWQRQAYWDRRPDGVVNLIHYADAATLTVAALRSGKPGTIYLGCDDQPITRQAIAQLHDPINPPRFVGVSGALGRRCDGAWTRNALGWQPGHRTFADGMHHS